METDRFYYFQSRFSSLYRFMRYAPQPIIAAVNGPAMGGGLSLALAADIRLASENAWFCAQYINVGVGGADMGSSYFLWRLVGLGIATEMCLTGSRVDAKEAYRIGLVNHVYDKEELMNAAKEPIEQLQQKLGLESSTLVVELGNAAVEIVRYADENNVDLIVLGSHGRHGVKLLLGSTANGVLHHANCDVLAVRISD